jgi:hypothetical protein
MRLALTPCKNHGRSFAVRLRSRNLRKKSGDGGDGWELSIIIIPIVSFPLPALMAHVCVERPPIPTEERKSAWRPDKE